jgi:DNA-binding CsgD family transcriptional regulator
MQKAAPLACEGWLATSEEVCAFEELGRSEFYNDCLRLNDIAHAMWGVIDNSRSRLMNVVGVYRNRGRPFESKDLELLRFLLPHMKRAFRLHLQLSELKAQGHNLQRAIDMLATGMIFFGGNGRIIHMNQTAAKLLAENDGLKVVHGYLRAKYSGETNDLEHLISQAKATSVGTGLGPGGAIVISRRVGPALQVLITPVRNITFDSATPVCTIAFVTDPSQKVRPAADILHALFGLTPAEIRVALLLCDGHAPPAIADLIGVSKNTLKTQLGSIYRKTGTSRQAQLVRTLSQLAMAPVDQQTMNGD